jgi:hypothetical protein
MVLTGCFEKFLKVVLRLPRLALEIMLDGRDVLLIGVVCFLVITVVACSDCDALGCHFFPFLLPFAPFLASLVVALGHATRLPPSTAFTFTRMKAAPTTSLLEVCLVVMPNSCLVVLG